MLLTSENEAKRLGRLFLLGGESRGLFSGMGATEGCSDTDGMRDRGGMSHALGGLVPIVNLGGMCKINEILHDLILKI